MIVAISVACGAGSDVDPITMIRCRYSVVMPMTNDAVSTPMTRPTCCRIGVAPTRKPVFRSCEVAPAIDGRDADDRADAERDRRVDVAEPADARRRCCRS